MKRIFAAGGDPQGHVLPHRSQLMKKVLVAAIVLAATAARATPTTTFWAPSNTAIQPFLVPHITYDTYFWKGPAAGQAGSHVYPVDTGLTIGVPPWEHLHFELGFDLALPSPDPVQLNAQRGWRDAK